MNVLFVNPPLYTFYGFHNTHQYAIYMYNLATKFKIAGDTVDIIDMHPELAFNKSVSSIDGNIQYDGVPLVSSTETNQECGNFESEKLIKPIVRSGLPKTVLEKKLLSNNFDKIIVCNMGSKSDISSSSAYYSNLGISEVLDIVKKSGYNKEVVVSGKYSKLFTNTSGLKSFHDDDCELVDTDLSLIPYRPRKIGILTSLGCKNNCFFCFVRSLEGDRVISKSPDKVLSFIDYITSMGYNGIRLMDSDILSGWDSHMRDIFDKIIEGKYGLSFSSYGGYEPSAVTDEIIEKSAEIGFKDMVLPLDNCDSSKLSFWGGAKSVEAWVKAVSITRKYFKNISSYIMMGYPGQTKENISESISMCLNEGVTPALLPFTPLDGTGYEDNKISPERKHPLLFPYAWEKFTVFDMEYLLQKYSTWYKKNTVKIEEGPNVYRNTGTPISIDGANNG